MQVTERIHQITMPFSLELADGRKLKLAVNIFLLVGDRIWLVDAGIKGGYARIAEYLKVLGRDAREIAGVVITHAHPDHMGGIQTLREETGCAVFAHELAVPWIQDAELQFRERPIPSFWSIVEGSAKVDAVFADGTTIDAGQGFGLSVIHAPGHSKDHAALYIADERLIICGDAVPVPGRMIIYEDPIASVASLKKMQAVPGVRTLLSSWDEPRRDNDVHAAFTTAISIIQKVHHLVRVLKADQPTAGPKEIAATVVERLGLPPFANNALFAGSIAAHLRALTVEDVCT